MRNIFQKLYAAYRVQAAKLLLYRLRDKGWIDMPRKVDRVYRDAEIKFMIENPYYLEIFIMTGDEDMKRLEIPQFFKKSSYEVMLKEFTKSNAPQVGDTVLLRKRITKNSPKFRAAFAKICEIVK